MGYHDEMEDYRDYLQAEKKANTPYGPQTSAQAEVEAMVDAVRRIYAPSARAVFSSYPAAPRAPRIMDDLADGK